MCTFINLGTSLPNINQLFNALPGNIVQGLIWGLLALGVFITFRLLDFPDMTVDGSFTTGAAVTVIAILNDVPVPLALVIAAVFGIFAGFITGVLHTKFGIPAILSGILTQIALWSINLMIMGSANVAISVDNYSLIISARNLHSAIITGLIFCAVIIAILYWYFGTEQGSAIRATGSNPTMSSASSININLMKIIALCISNALVALAGGLIAQYQGYVAINMGQGAIVIGLAAVIIGEVIGNAILGKKMNFIARLIFIVLGAIIYYAVICIVLWLKMPADSLKLFTAITVAIFLAVPYIKGNRTASFKAAGKRSKLIQEEQKNA